jgi:hypothetical protein
VVGRFHRLLDHSARPSVAAPEVALSAHPRSERLLWRTASSCRHKSGQCRRRISSRYSPGWIETKCLRQHACAHKVGRRVTGERGIAKEKDSLQTPQDTTRRLVQSHAADSPRVAVQFAYQQANDNTVCEHHRIKPKRRALKATPQVRTLPRTTDGSCPSSALSIGPNVLGSDAKVR